jgi:hypothetical protein
MTDHQAKQMTVQRQILADNRFALLEQTLTDAIGEAIYSHAIKAAGKPIPFVLS